ncbi:MAG: Mfa1 family fimbria major subunit [Muribaculaceae bacterium]|nr:Mfa1 family fimbria major subunit [Muribaculaceae bacterium]
MAHYNKWLIGLMGLSLLTACSDDVVQNTEPTPVVAAEGDGVFMSINIQLPNGRDTRSYTNGDDSSNGGTEVGTDAENNINEVLLVLANNNNGFIAAATINNNKLIKLTAGDAQAYRATSKFSKTDLNNFYQTYTGEGNPIVKVFLFVNPNAGIVNAIEAAKKTPGSTGWVNAICTLTADQLNTLWTDNKFVMSNLYMAERELPANLDKWAAYSLESHAFDLSGFNNAGTDDEIDNQNSNRGAVRVHRMAARFDFKDGSPAETGPNTYNVLSVRNDDGSAGEPLVQVRLNKMTMVNINNKMYYLERTSPDGMSTDAVILGPEKPWYVDANGKPITITGDNGQPVTVSGNFVVTPWSDDFQTLTDGEFTKADFDKYFLSPFFNNEGSTINGWVPGGRWAGYTYKIDDVLTQRSDNYDKKEYHFWRYCTENALPDPENENEVNGLSTGVVFKGKLIATEKAKDYGYIGTDVPNDEELTLFDVLNNTGKVKLGDTNKDPIIYMLNNTLFVTWHNLYLDAIAQSFNPETEEWNRASSLYQAVFGNGGTGYSYIKTEAGEGQEAVIYTDPLPQDETSANYLWNQWDKAGRPASGNPATTAFKDAATAAGITLYQSSQDADDGWGYYCYYYYWNRHNDNGNNGVMGPMEFAVVRNNVYKLAVTNLRQLGHPRQPENDPDRPKPNTPDESDNVYMTVTAEVVPWVVRINNIEF